MAKDLSRRKFLKLMAGAGTIGMTVALTSGGEKILTDKGEQPGGDGWITDQYNGKGDFSLHLKGRVAISYDNPAIITAMPMVAVILQYKTLPLTILAPERTQCRS